MRDISIISGRYFKHGDNDTDVVLRLFNDSNQVELESLDGVKVKLRGANSHIVDIFKPDSINNDEDLVISSNRLTGLKDDTYAIEVWVIEGDKTQVYPSSESPNIVIMSNIDDENSDD